MRCFSYGTIALIAAVVGLASGELLAQPGVNYSAPNPYPAGPQAGRSGPIQALFTTPFGGGNADYVDAHGGQIVMPAGYYPSGPGSCECSDCYGYGPTCPPPCADGYYGCDDGYGYGYGGGCPGGCPPTGGNFGRSCGSGTYPPFEDGLENFSLLPPGRTEQCGPHYFDVRMEAIVMTRDETFATPVDFASQNVAGPIMLSSNQLDFDWEGGFRILGRYDVGPLTVVEFGYWGLENLDSQATFDNPAGDSYSLFTDFVRDTDAVPATVTDPGGALPWTERSVIDRISLESELHNAEFNCRRYWVGFNPKVSGTLLAGFRYTRLREDFQFFTMGAPELTFDAASGTYDENIKNDMAGFQVGGDVWLHISQGLRIGAEGKVGLANNHYTLVNTFTGIGENDETPASPNFSEKFEKDQPALIVDASADVVWDLCPSWSIRAGYEMLFLNSVLLAGENFNTGSIYNRPDGPDFGVTLPERIPFVNDQGNAFYHGGHLGLEYVW